VHLIVPVAVVDELDIPQGRGVASSDVVEGSPDRLRLVAVELQDAVMASLFGVWPVCP
jgi:hypothetical protein